MVPRIVIGILAAWMLVVLPSGGSAAVRFPAADLRVGALALADSETSTHSLPAPVRLTPFGMKNQRRERISLGRTFAMGPRSSPGPIWDRFGVPSRARRGKV